MYRPTDDIAAYDAYCERMDGNPDDGSSDDAARDLHDDWSWRFGVPDGCDPTVIVTHDGFVTTLRVDYDIGPYRLAGGARFTLVDGPELTEEALDELAFDMQRYDGAQFIPIQPKHYRKGA